MRRHFIATIASLGVAALALGSAAAQDAPGVTKDEIKLGTWAALTGPFSVYGVPGVAGQKAYYGLLNDQGGVNGRKINLIVEDHAYNPQQAVAAARKLVDSDQVLAIQGGHATGPSAAALPYLEQSGVPYITPFGGAVDWYTPTRALIFGAQALFDDQARVLGRWAGKDGFKNILVIHSAVAAFEKVALQVEPGVRTAWADAKVELMPVKIGTTDYVPIALEVASKKPDAVVFIGAIQEYVALAKEVKQQGITTQLFTYGGSVANDTVELGGDAVEGTRSVSYSLPIDSDAPAVKEYRDALAKYVPDEKPDYASLLTFALAKIAVEAIRNAKEPLTRESLVESLNSMQDFDTGIIGKVSYGPDKHLGTTSVQPVELKGGKWVTVGGFVDAHADW